MKDYEAWSRRAVELLDVLEEPPQKGNGQCCTVKRCTRQMVSSSEGPFGQRRLCAHHAPLYAEHDRILEAIRG